MTSPKTPSTLAFLPLAILIGLVGWAGLFWIFNFTLPTVGPRWLFFFFWFLALTGTAMPVVAFLNRRFSVHFPADAVVITRQSMWFGVYGGLLAWLQIGRLLTPGVAAFFALVFVLIEMGIRLNERSKYKQNP